MNKAQQLSLLNPVHLLALGFGSGLSPKAPGTMGTLVAIPLVWLLAQLSVGIYVAVTAVATVVGIWICAYSATAMGEHDHPAIVWDEIAGYAIAMTLLPPTLLNLTLAFVLFRLFDILKPGPIGWCDKKLHGGLGIMADDVLAGIAACVLIHAGYWLVA
ncbi:phosphatidylglycerophosphatase [Pseudidiomarina planktonica]|uniref:Phosphatidylglycerophosphatase A n=1 Tax=Pseudidiomarina planktonica TaxID=1323738 RepID=A0A1Y6FX41_9GAMM|nr:phosphatidylglycerophosphatase A [Pseudidiomarina planktonica]RUO63353.1 phosphatidylglycerophosphatase A [Pseudidiomarina planktonica]SMQ80423.1 phosphatidylglycerophosphatase [Pseudidiomarina planktonica]